MHHAKEFGSSSVERLVTEFGKLPGIGRKTAQRLTFYLMKMERERAQDLADAIVAMKEHVRYCSVCFNMTDQDPCPICSDPKRERTIICVVEEPSDVLALERTGAFSGLYHVLGGVLSPLDGIGPDDLRIRELLHRIRDGVGEVILANNPSVEGEATALYLVKLIKPLDVKVSQMARGLPMGGDLEWADALTLTRAMEGRREID
ncbi:MAG: recombination protein RecR [Candidatus Latescibacteria bacterium]|nr:recombination protein RecR [Candidatus Latescibacterota bacterium]MCK5381633.1 recombination protein RecR [Candidatus Latescibacterota bacterium]